MLVYQLNSDSAFYIKPFFWHIKYGLMIALIQIDSLEMFCVQDTVLVICVLKAQLIVMCCGQTDVSYQCWTIIKLCKIIITIN